MNAPTLAVVVIGRNEGERLSACLESVRAVRKMPESTELIYVDSSSTDDSPERAAACGAMVIKLGPGKLSAARARNAGWRAATAPFILFLDGDTILDPDFVGRASQEFADPNVAVVCGQRREIRPERSIYNRVLDLDWVSPAGDSLYCGGDSLMRREILERVNGFNPDLIAGEEPDLCRRIRAMDCRIRHLDIPMTGHDLALLHFRQYWRRAVRTGHAYAEISERYRKTSDPLWTDESRANVLRGVLYLLTTLGILVAAVLLRSWIPLLVWTLGGTALAVRTAILASWKSSSTSTLLWFGFHSHVQHVPIFLGQMLYRWDRWRGRGRLLIEYKTKSS
jgi:cellulose synthase/poly-beta-1,6-N-acetylglucosamine synthase-like glycosyltransferase